MTTPSSDSSYIGRFAPSPTGPLHFGSLVSALASYLDAKANSGTWLVRMEDIDPPREVPGAADQILHQLEHHGLLWDDQVLYQSQRSEAYLAALQQLREDGLLYPCQCTRQQLKATGGIHNYRCQINDSAAPSAQRLAVSEHSLVQFNDFFQGPKQQQISDEAGDFILLRKDGLFAYQLAVVVDDAFQQISHVIRGCDLLDTTPTQLYLQQVLGLPSPEYGHIPMAVNRAGQKLSKQNLAPAIENHRALANLIQAMDWLGLTPPTELTTTDCPALLQWAIDHWQRERIPQQMERVASY